MVDSLRLHVKNTECRRTIEQQRNFNQGARTCAAQKPDLNFTRGVNHDLIDFSILFDAFFESDGSPGRSGDHASVMARFAATTSTAAITSLLPAPSVTTDQDDYAPGDTATITASGFDAGATVTFEVDHVDGPGDDGVYGTADDEVVETGGAGHDPWTVTDGGAGDLDGEANGTIVTTWHVNADDSLDERFVVSASDGENTATNTFTDGDIDLRTDAATGTANGAWFVQSGADASAGTGLINAFVRVHASDNEEGYNTDARPLQFDENSSPSFTKSLLLSEVPIVENPDLNVEIF